MGWPIQPVVPLVTETALVAALTDALGDVRVSTDTIGYTTGDRRVVIAVLPGTPRGPRGQVPVNVISMGGDKTAASELAGDVHAAMLGLPTVTGSVQAVRATNLPYPIPTPDATAGLARYSASYLVLVSSTTA